MRTLFFLALTSLLTGCAGTVNRFSLAYTSEDGRRLEGGWEIANLAPTGFSKNPLGERKSPLPDPQKSGLSKQ